MCHNHDVWWVQQDVSGWLHTCTPACAFYFCHTWGSNHIPLHCLVKYQMGGRTMKANLGCPLQFLPMTTRQISGWRCFPFHQSKPSDSIQVWCYFEMAAENTYHASVHPCRCEGRIRHWSSRCNKWTTSSREAKWLRHPDERSWLPHPGKLSGFIIQMIQADYFIQGSQLASSSMCKDVLPHPNALH